VTAVARHKLALSTALALWLLAAQFAAVRLSPWDAPVRVALPLTIALVPVALWPHRRHLGVWVMFVGMAANLAAILSHGGLMPIERSTVVAAVGEERAAAYAPGEWIRGSKDVLVPERKRAAVALGDSIVVRVGDGGFVASPGDVVVALGLILLAAEASLAWQRGAAGRRAETGVRVPARGLRRPAGEPGG
jgi:hypothetical protein